MSNSTDKELPLHEYLDEINYYNYPEARNPAIKKLKALINNAVVAEVAKELSTVIKIGENTGDPSENLIVKYRRIDDYCRQRLERLKKGADNG